MSNDRPVIDENGEGRLLPDIFLPYAHRLKNLPQAGGSFGTFLVARVLSCRN
ncbi:MAG: hypothetical protein A4E65_01885 [Syntrophorhabdus sp. PtaU1.Bin153]|nr:MAG: hypothetical protein A4E65_01885 [Syntrophorhabdus sp. PtaU1.Bin153]